MDSVPSVPSTYFPEKLFETGVSDLISVIPPKAQLSPQSRIPSSQLGKIPGRIRPNGTWSGFNWRQYTATIADVRQWQQDRANVGLKADRFPAVDIDCHDEQLAELIASRAIAYLGAAPTRIGKPPKRLLLYRTNAPFGRMRLWFKTPAETDTGAPQSEHLVEILGRGQQFLVHGTHPSGRQYEWLKDPTEQPLTEVTSALAGKFLDELESELQKLGYQTRREGDGRGGAAADRARETDQASLRAPSIGALREAVDLIPNDESFPSRTDYIRVGYAIKAAAGIDYEDDGFEIFAEWAARWQDGYNDPEVVLADWRRMTGEKSVGWGYIADLAAQHGFNAAQYEFAAIGSAPSDDLVVRIEPVVHSDQWLAIQIAAARANQIRYVPQRDRFLVWDGSRWREDDDLAVDDTIKRELARVAEPLSRAGSGEERRKNQRLARSICSASKAGAVRKLLQSERAITVTVDQLDHDPWIINTPGGVVDLRTGEMRPSNPGDLCTLVTAAAPEFNGDCPTWKRFLSEATGGDVELARISHNRH